MKQSMKRILSVLLAGLLLFGLLPFSAFAEQKSAFKKYTVLGDSNPSGFGTAAYVKNAGGEQVVKDGSLIAGTYPALVAEKLGISAKNVNVRSHSGWRTNEFLRMLSADPSATTDSMSDNYLYALGFLDANALKGEPDRLRSAIRSAELITVDFGSNDIFTHALNQTNMAHPTVSRIFASPLSATLLLGALVPVIADFEKYIKTNAATFKQNIDRVVSTIRQLNPTAKIMLLGVHSPFDDSFLQSFALITSGGIASVVRDVNDYLKNKSPLRSEYTYVDTTDTDCFGNDFSDLKDFFSADINQMYAAIKGVHPSEAGHRYLAAQIIDALGTDASPISAKEFVNRLYQVCLGREPDSEGLSGCLWQLSNGVTGIELAKQFIFSDEFSMKNYCDRHYVIALYEAFMGREPEKAEEENWVWRLQQGATREAVFNEFALSPEFGAICSDAGIKQGKAITFTGKGTRQGGYCTVSGCTAHKPISEFATRLYTVCLDRTPAQNEIDAWYYGLVHGDYTATTASDFFLFSEEFKSHKYSNKSFVKHIYQAMMGRAPASSELEYWVWRLEDGTTRKAVFKEFAASDEFAVICAQYGVVLK